MGTCCITACVTQLSFINVQICIELVRVLRKMSNRIKVLLIRGQKLWSWRESLLYCSILKLLMLIHLLLVMIRVLLIVLRSLQVI